MLLIIIITESFDWKFFTKHRLLFIACQGIGPKFRVKPVNEPKTKKRKDNLCIWKKIFLLVSVGFYNSLFIVLIYSYGPNNCVSISNFLKIFNQSQHQSFIMVDQNIFFKKIPFFQKEKKIFWKKIFTVHRKARNIAKHENQVGLQTRDKVICRIWAH